MTTAESVSIELNVSNAFINRAIDFLTSDYLPKIERCLEQLSDQQIWWRSNEESNSIGNLVLHLCGNARQWIVCGLGSEADTRTRDAEFAQRDVVPRPELLALLRSTLAGIPSRRSALKYLSAMRPMTNGAMIAPHDCVE